MTIKLNHVIENLMVKEKITLAELKVKAAIKRGDKMGSSELEIII